MPTCFFDIAAGTIENFDDQMKCVLLFMSASLSGPLLNPAIAFGQMLLAFNFSYIIEYVLCPLGGAAIALVFYELVFVKTQEYLAEEDDTSDNEKDDLEPGPMN
jgi:hypothetical protein